MICNKAKYYLSNNVFVLPKYVLYDDVVQSHNNTIKVSSFNSLESIVKVDTVLDTLYLRPNESILCKESIYPTVDKVLSDYLYTDDEVFYSYRQPTYGNNEHTFNDNLYLKNKDYSVNADELLYKYNLPKSFLIKALTTGCPDEENKHSVDNNNKLKLILKQLGYSEEEELRDLIIRTNSSTVPKIKISYDFLILSYYCITSSYQLRSGTKVTINRIDDIHKQRLINLFTSLSLPIVVSTNSITVDSNLMFNLFSSEFNNYSFLLSLSKTFSYYLFKLLKNTEVFSCNHQLSLKYLQEYLYTYKSLYTINDIDNTLSIIEDYRLNSNGFLIKVLSVQPVLNCTDFIEIM